MRFSGAGLGDKGGSRFPGVMPLGLAARKRGLHLFLPTRAEAAFHQGRLRVGMLRQNVRNIAGTMGHRLGPVITEALS